MTEQLRCTLKPYLQPFERSLALMELQQIAGDKPRKVGSENHVYSVHSQIGAHELSLRTAYWETINNGHPMLSWQVRLEVANDRTETPGATRVPNRRILRYGPHGLHEYRGKFFPQLVRSLINISSIPRDGVIGDPMVGSGTTMVEALMAGHRTRGIDMNPLSVLMSQVKCSVLTADPGALAAATDRLMQRVFTRGARGTPYFDSLPESDQFYLSRWIPSSALRELDRIYLAISRTRNPHFKELFRLLLSDTIREVSWQDNDDLRVRRDVASARPDVRGAFSEKVEKAIARITPFLRTIRDRGIPIPSYELALGDARRISDVWGRNPSVDCVISSPPYATALPYLDTDRLSLVYLGLLERDKHRMLDLEMIGNREVNEGHRTAYLRLLEEQRETIPTSVARLVKRIMKLQASKATGFRRRNLPALLVKYFADMGHVMSGIRKSLKPNGDLFLVVGTNHTIAGGKRVDIDTPLLLRDLSEMHGFSHVMDLQMELLVSRDIFRRNRGSSESILWLKQTT